MRFGESSSSRVYSALRVGLRTVMLPATDASVAIRCMRPAMKAATVASLSSKRPMPVPAGASFVSSSCSSAPRVTATDLPARTRRGTAGAAGRARYTALQPRGAVRGSPRRWPPIRAR